MPRASRPWSPTRCADDTKGQTCFICTQALHWKTKEGLVRMCACRGTAGFAHVSCLAEQAKILVAEGEENNLGAKARTERWHRWDECSLCKQRYDGVVRCALSWGCWKTYVGRPETDEARRLAMSLLGNGLFDAEHYEEALSVRETELSMLHRIKAPEYNILCAQGNLAISYEWVDRNDEALRIRRDLYAGRLKQNGEEHKDTLIEANNLANLLFHLDRFEEVKSLSRKTMPVARRVLGEGHGLTLRILLSYGRVLYRDPDASPDDLREAVTTLEETERIARRVFGGAHSLTKAIERHLQNARAALRVHETLSPKG